ncbi:hypothetical protein SVAN01_07778 [Stagonosporopsis vannaccii]|nr:hypothetical protein SVAN01_07778 [Stagonosporopsis vannaccii]
MPPASSSFTPLNIADDVVPEYMASFTLAAPPNTDLWRKPPSRDTSTAPVLYTALRNPFIAAEVTVSADWELEWDQGGLVIFAGTPPGQPTPATSPDAPTVHRILLDNSTTPAGLTSNSCIPISSSITRTPTPPPSYPPPVASKWVKLGLEFCANAPHATSVVASPDGADWSLTALPAYHTHRTHLRVKMERIGCALWLWYEDEMVGWKKLREVTWFFWGVEDKSVRVGVYASRPANFGGSLFEQREGSGNGNGGFGMGVRNLCVDFEGLEIF